MLSDVRQRLYPTVTEWLRAAAAHYAARPERRAVLGQALRSLVPLDELHMYGDPVWHFTFPEDLERDVRLATRARIDLASLHNVAGRKRKYGPSHTFRMHLDVEDRMMEEIAASLLLAPKAPLSWMQDAAKVMARRGNMHRLAIIEALAEVVEDIPGEGLSLPADVDKELRRAMRSRLAGGRQQQREMMRRASTAAMHERESQVKLSRPRPDFIKGMPRSAMRGS